MSECHDIYDPIGYPDESALATAVLESAAQCHDPYSPEIEAPSSSTRAVHDFDLRSDRQGQVRVVRVVGRLDGATQGQFRDLMQNHCAEPEVIIDLSETTSDAAGTGVLLAATARAGERNQQLVFVVTDPLELEVLVFAGLNLVVPIVASETEAQEWLESHRISAA